MANKMSICIIKYTYTQYVGVDIEKYTRGLFEYVKEEFGEFQPQMSEPGTIPDMPDYLDIVLHLADGRYALIECKLGSREIEDGAKHLLQLRDLIREKNKTEHQMPLREPDLLIVMTGGEMAYTREDGVKVIPLATLKD